MLSAINHTIDEAILEADGRYLDTQALQSLEQFMHSYATRLDVYQQLRDQSDKLVLMALRKMGQSHPEIIQQHGPRCKYDMSETLRYIALSILRDDEIFFKEQMSVWLDTILLAHKRTSHCADSYRYLQEAIHQIVPSANSLVKPYFDIVIVALQSHA